MANGPWVSQASGDTTPLIVQPIVTGFVFVRTYTISLIDDNNVVTGPRSFIDWTVNSLQFTVSATPGGPPIFAVVGSGAGEGVTFQDAAAGVIRLQVSALKTDLLQAANLKIAYGWLGGLDGTGVRRRGPLKPGILVVMSASMAEDGAITASAAFPIPASSGGVAL